MAETKYSGAPFGSNCSRFINHRVPKVGTNERLGPGSYDVEQGDFNEKAIIRRASGPGWARAYETSHMIALPYLLNKEEWERKIQMQYRLGPGTYDAKMVECEKNYSRGILDTREPRFREAKVTTTPGPGTYGKNGIPHSELEEKSRQTAGTVGLLDRGGTSTRSLPLMGSMLGPGTYTIPSSIDELKMKKTGTRGPYEVFSADRSKPILTGHYAAQVDCNLGPGQYDITSGVDEIYGVRRKHHGKFGKAAQYPARPTDRITATTLSLNPRSSSEPGPGYYEPKNPCWAQESCSVKPPPFLSSSQRVDKLATKFFTGNFNPVGPGRYDTQKVSDTHDVHGCRSAFQSQTARPEGLRLQVLRERLKPRYLLPGEKAMLVHHEVTACH